MTAMPRLLVALALAAAARPLPPLPTVPVSGTVTNSNGLTGTFTGTLTPRFS